MADIALAARATTTRKIDVVRIPSHSNQMTMPAAEAIVAGAPVRLDTSNGRWTNANASSAGEARVWGVAARTVAAGDSLTAYRRGTIDGYVLDAIAYDGLVYLSNTDGTLADAAGTTSVVIGRVIPAWGVPTGTGADKLLDLLIPQV